jgi:hypothetical protein
MSWQIIYQFAYHHPPGPGSSGFPWGQFIPGATYAGYSPVTSAPHAHIRSRLDIASIIQKKGGSFREFIQRFCNKRNIIPEVDDKYIVIFFKKGLRDLSLIRKLGMKNPRTSEAMLAITYKYALAKEVTLDTREHKKEKDPGHADYRSTTKGHDKKRKADHSVNMVEWP